MIPPFFLYDIDTHKKIKPRTSDAESLYCNKYPAAKVVDKVDNFVENEENGLEIVDNSRKKN